MKHYTSKLTDFSDLTSVATFGFRGEALSSLCALATLTVQTCHGDEQHGTEVTYNHNGGIESKGVCAHKRGTTVRLDGLFAGWPVRHREMKRNLKKEFGKMVQLLQAYCLVRPDVRIACVNVSPKGSKAKVLSSPGRNDLKSVITVLFGGKQLQALSPYTAADAATNAAEPAGSGAGASADGEGGAAAAAAAPRITITGYISKAKPECGRGSGDRQFLSINSRPCDLGKVSKAITEVYHQCVPCSTRAHTALRPLFWSFLLPVIRTCCCLLRSPCDPPPHPIPPPVDVTHAGHSHALAAQVRQRTKPCVRPQH